MPTLAELISKHRFDGSRCVVPGCRSWAVEAHHVTYDPPEIVPMCHEHHDDITAINCQQARGPLSNNQRRSIWRRFLRGDFKRPK